MDLSLSGLASGFDWKTVVDQLADVERAPQRRLRSQQADLNFKKDALSSLIAEIGNLKSRADSVAQASLFTGAGVAKSTDETAGTANATASTPSGAYTFKVYQKATAAVHQGATDVSQTVNTAAAVDSASSGMATLVTAGTFTINGKTVTITSGDTLDTIVTNINSSGSGVTASYDATSDKIILTAASTFTVGNSTDTSNFLQATRLSGSNQYLDTSADPDVYTVRSASKLGGLGTTTAMSSVGLRTALTDNGSGAGQFKVNGVTIDWSTTDTFAAVLGRINDSSAGVLASYDAVNDRVVLTNKSTGNVGISFEDVAGQGNFLAATRLSTGTLKNGQDLLYTVNGSALLTSRSNTITAESSGITGLTVNALKAPGDAARVISESDAAANTLELTGHGYATGTAVNFFTTDTLPSNLDTKNTFYVRPTDADHVKIYNNATDAFNDTGELDLDATVLGLNTVVSAAPASFTITVGSDNSAIKKAITDFVDQYNKTQSLIESQSASSTDAKGKVTAGVLASDQDVASVAQLLRSKTISDVSGITSTIKRLESIGFKSDGFSNKISLVDGSKLDTLLAQSLSEVKALFTNTTDGVGVRLKTFLETVVGENGTLVSHRDSFSKQSTNLDTQIASMEKQVLTNRQRMVESFVAMEKAQAKVNQQMQFLASRFK
jgi:flagellar capping protein FliD